MLGFAAFPKQDAFKTATLKDSVNITGSGRVVSFTAAAIIGISLACLPAPPAFAEERKGSWEFGLLFGNNFYAKEQKLPNATDTGLRIGWNFRPAYELEIQYLRTATGDVSASDSTLISDPGVFFAESPAFRSESYSLRFLINPRNERRRLKPYGFFGVGNVTYSSDPKLPESELGYRSSAVLAVGRSSSAADRSHGVPGRV